MDENAKKELKKITSRRMDFKVQEVVILVVITCIFSFFAGTAFTKMKENPEVLNSEPLVMSDELVDFIYTYQNIVNQYYKDVDEKVLLNAALKGVLSEIEDPYSIYMDEDEYSNLNINLEGSYDGLGISIEKDSATNYMIVRSVFKNSAADKAGLKVDDAILSVNGKDVTGLTTSEFSALVLQGEETKYVMSVLRGEETLSITVEKANVVIPSIETEIFERNNKKIGYIYISIFAKNTSEQFKEELKKFEKGKIDALIIDVRDNTGGHLTAVEDILSQFFDSSYIIYQLEQDGQRQRIHSDGDETKEYPIALLANQYSASASEVLIGCLKDNLGAIVIGEKTYGKGTVQQLVDLSNGDQYKITTKKWLTPKGTWVNDTNGIAPDIEVKLSEEYFNNPSNETDNQLQRALEELSK